MSNKGTNVPFWLQYLKQLAPKKTNSNFPIRENSMGDEFLCNSFIFKKLGLKRVNNMHVVALSDSWPWAICWAHPHYTTLLTTLDFSAMFVCWCLLHNLSFNMTNYMASCVDNCSNRREQSLTDSRVLCWSGKKRKMYKEEMSRRRWRLTERALSLWLEIILTQTTSCLLLLTTLQSIHLVSCLSGASKPASMRETRRGVSPFCLCEHS